MEKITLDITEMANGGNAVARAKRGRTVFVPLALPGEKVRAEIVKENNKIAFARVLEVLRPSPDRIEPTCPYFGVCGGCHFQHMRYETQLEIKREVVIDQLERIGGFKNVPVLKTLSAARPWAYSHEMELSPAASGGLGYWSPGQKQVIPIEECPISRPELLGLLQDIDLELPGLRKLSLRLSDDEALLAAVEVDGVEAPQLEADFPVSVAIVLPDKTAVNLVGDNYNIQTVNGRDFRVSPGCYFHINPATAGIVIDAILRAAALNGREQLLELYSGVGTLTAFLAAAAAQVIAVEQNPDAVADTAVNLTADNVSLYEGAVEDILPQLDITPDIVVVNPPPQGLSAAALRLVLAQNAGRIIYVSADVATFARDGREMAKAGYQLKEVQPVDGRPQTYHVDVVGCFEIGD